MTSKNYEKIALDYANSVVDGEILACQYVVQACQRQLDDLDREDFGFIFNPLMEDREGKEYRPGNRVCAFVERLNHTKGEWLTPTINLEPCQIFWVMCIFGWVDQYGYRRFKEAYTELPRKNAKSTLWAGIELYMLCADGEQGPDVYCGARDSKQAKIVWGVAYEMAQKNPQLVEHYGLELPKRVTTNANISRPSVAGTFAALASDMGGNLDGLNIHFCVIDELHGHASRNLYDVIISGTGSRKNALISSISTAGFNLAGICFEQRQYVVKILDKVCADDRYWGIIYTIDEDDDWADPSIWAKANPLYGVSVMVDDMEKACTKALATPSAVNNFLTKRLNVWVSSGTAWMDMRAWGRCADTSLKIEDFAGEDCHLGLDLATKNDIASFNVTFRKMIDGREHYYGFTFNFLNEEAISDGRNSQYSGWARSGNLISTPGNVTDHRMIENAVRDIASNYKVVSAAYDDWQGQYIANNLMEDGGLNMICFKQNTANMNPAMVEWEALVKEGRYHHNGCPAMTWMVSNVIAKANEAGHIYPRKQNNASKIDGPVSQLMAMGRWLTDRRKLHSYSQRGLRTLD